MILTQNPNIFRIDKGKRVLKGKTSSDEIIEKIISTSFKKLGYTSKFKMDSLKTFEKDDIKYFLHLFSTNETESVWKEFLPSELTLNQNFNQQRLSLILFVESENELFCVVGGNAYQMITPFIDQSFGLNTYSRIIDPNEDQLASIKSRGITGARAGISEQFRDNYRMIDFIKFGKLPQEILLKLSQETTDLHFSYLKKRDDERIQIFVGKSFKIKKSVDFENLHNIILEFRDILQLAPDDYLSSYKEIDDENFIESYLQPELIERIFNDAAMLGRPSIDRTFEYDFCNPNDIQKFYEADEYKLKERTKNGGYVTFNTVNDRSLIYDNVLRRAVERFGINDKFSFMVFLQGVRITCYDNNKKTIGSNFLFHITTEFPIRSQPIFLVDTKWYKLRDSFVIDLKANTERILKTYNAPSHILTETWDKSNIRREGDYNMLYNNKKGYIVIDTLIVDGLELCDIIHYDDDNIYLIHVKHGFSSQMRELTNQVMISARRLRETLATSDKNLLDKNYKKLLDKGRDVDSLSLSEFRNLFTKKNNYVLAYTSHLKDDLEVVDNIDRFSSNIARFSLIQCSGEMRASYYDLLNYQIKRK